MHVPFGSYCMIHAVFEPDMPGDYRACLECLHVYRTPWDLLMADLAIQLDWVRDGWEGQVRTIDPEQIYSCPLCCHDF